MSTKMVKIKVSNLVGSALDYAVALADGQYIVVRDGEVWWGDSQFGEQGLYAPSTNCNHSYPIIAREGIATRQYRQKDFGIFDARHYDESKGDVIRYAEECKRDMVFRPVVKSANNGMWYAKASDASASASWGAGD